MISRKKLEEQLKRINFHYDGWGRSEIRALLDILRSDEEIEECVNGYYEAGFALLVSTKDRVLLIDKKPLGYLTVEDMRFDMINELDLHKRLMGAQIRISAGAKTLLFTSLNQVRLARLLNYVQSRMTQIKKDASEHLSTQKQHLEEMNEQLRLYLMAAHKQQFIDQANAIQSGHAYGQPAFNSQFGPQFGSQYGPQSAGFAAPPQPAQHSTVQPKVEDARQAKSPFEQAALAAFDGRTPQVEAPAVQGMLHESTPEHTEQEPDKTEIIDASPRPVAHILSAVPHYSQAALKRAEQIVLTPQQVGLAAARRVVPIISAYTRLPLMSQRRRYRHQHQH